MKKVIRIICLLLALVTMLGTLAACQKDEGKVFYEAYPIKGMIVYVSKIGDYTADYPNSYLLYVDRGDSGPLAMLLITEDTILAPNDRWASLSKEQLVGKKIDGYAGACAEGVYHLYPRLYIMHTVSLAETAEE